MEALILQRKYIRISFTKTYKILLEKVEHDSEENEKQVNILIAKLESLTDDLNKLDESIVHFVLEQNDETKFETEFTSVESYKDFMFRARIEASTFLGKRARKENNDGLSNCSKCSSPISSRKNLHLPKIEIKRFGGDIKDWLSFWTQFKRIHEDKQIEIEDKFQYLIQSMIVGSKARDIIDSFPATAENYEKAIDVLKMRFGREEVLIEYYVRELISLVIKNTNSAKGKVNVSQLYDKLESHLRALESIGMTRDKYAAMLFPLVESCIPEEILRAWIRSPLHKVVDVEANESQNGYSARLQQLLTFLRSEVEGEERISMAKSGFKAVEKPSNSCKEKYKKIIDENVPTASNLYFGGRPSSPNKTKLSSTICLFCDKAHESKECFNAQKLTTAQKREVLTKKNGCFVCLKVGHISKNCKSYVKCIVCGRKHTTIMCPTLDKKENTKVAENSSDHTQIEGKECTSLASQSTSGPVLLQTLVVNLSKPSGNHFTAVRALIDSGSQRSYILKDTVEKINLEPEGNEELIHTLFGGVKSKINKHNRYKVYVSNLENENGCIMRVLDQPTICNPLPRLSYGPWTEDLKRKNIILSDFGEGQPKIELLIGADILGNLLTGKTFKMTNGLVAVHTLLGWTVMGKWSNTGKVGKKCSSYGCMVTSLYLQSEQLPDIWSLDVLGISDPYQTKTKKEMEIVTQNYFDSTVIVNEQGRYEIKLPWVECKDDIAHNRSTAEKRLQSTTAKLINENKYDDYEEVFNQWEAMGIIEEVMNEQSKVNGYFMPHRAVIKEQSTTKIRPVFDASSKTKNTLSLNDCLEKGPNLIELIPSALLKFREKKIGVTADIEKAFLQIAVNQEDCEYLKFLWWKNYEDKTLKVYRHRRVVFGVNCSPFLLIAVIKHHLKHCSEEFTETADKLKKSFYVDNCVTSLESKDELQQFMENAKYLMNSAKFNLRDWKSSLKEELIGDEEPMSVLGILWDRSTDELFCDVSSIKSLEVVTRRVILSTTQKIFDPIGFTCPVSLYPKLLLQESWKSKSSWDDEVPPDVKQKFLKWVSFLPYLSKIKIPRYIGMNNINDLDNVTLHTFCDASKISYATVIFLRTVKDGFVNVQLVMAKSRISPLKEMTIPRMELMACCIGARLSKTVKTGFGFDLSNLQEFFWTDSSTVLFWILKNQPWGTFVQNRVKEIREETGQRWYHIRSDLNPADLPSRGCSTKTLLESRWWEGPNWLKLPQEHWPKSDVCYDTAEIHSETKKQVVASLSNISESKNYPWYLKYFSKYSSIVRMVGWMLRFTNNARKSEKERVKTELSAKEITNAEYVLIKNVQIETLIGKNVSALKLICISGDKYDLLRVETKLKNRPDECNDFIFPIVLPNNHNLVNLMIMGVHKELSHAGVQVVLSKLRERFWILKGRKTVRSIINKCVICKRFTARNVTPQAISLPADRVRDAYTFEVTGLDLGGPLILRGGQKAWIVIFTCAVYRAVHFELIMSLSTNGFLLGFRRFVARRGRPRTIYSDNGTNFIGAKNLFKAIDWSYVERDSSALRIQWKFIPPTAAWWGGWWERIVGMVKNLLKRVLKKASVCYEEMVSILCDSEAVINSRPLTYLSEDPEEIQPLTPAMFLQENVSVEVPDLDKIDSNNLSRKFRYQQKLRQDLRTRFRDEYLSQLVLHSNKPNNQQPMRVGDVVLIGSDGKKRIDWPMGKIVNLYPGKDNIVRVVKLKTAFGELIRPVQRIFPLEISAESSLQATNQEVSHPEHEVHIGEQAMSGREHEIVKPPTIVKTSRGRLVKLPQKFSEYKL